MQSLREILEKFDWKQKKYISREFQDYGYKLAEELNDFKHNSFYIKLAKETPRKFLEQARSFVKEADGVRHRARLFMWKLNQLKNVGYSKKSEDGEKES